MHNLYVINCPVMAFPNTQAFLQVCIATSVISISYLSGMGPNHMSTFLFLGKMIIPRVAFGAAATVAGLTHVAETEVVNGVICHSLHICAADDQLESHRNDNVPLSGESNDSLSDELCHWPPQEAHHIYQSHQWSFLSSPQIWTERNLSSSQWEVRHATCVHKAGHSSFD